MRETNIFTRELLLLYVDHMMLNEQNIDCMQLHSQTNARGYIMYHDNRPFIYIVHVCTTSCNQ